MRAGDRLRDLTPLEVRTVMFFTLLVAAVVVTAAILWRSADRASDEALTAPPVPRWTPPEVPVHGSLVTSHVRPDGRIDVVQWLRSRAPLSTVVASIPDTPLPPEAPRATELRVTAPNGAPLAGPENVGSTPTVLALSRAVRLVRLSYVLDGVVERSSTVAGRVLAGVTYLDVDERWRHVPTTVRVSGGDVLSLGCSAVRRDAVPRACGTPDGTGWTVSLPPEAEERLVIAQLDLDEATDGTG